MMDGILDIRPWNKSFLASRAVKIVAGINVTLSIAISTSTFCTRVNRVFSAACLLTITLAPTDGNHHDYCGCIVSSDEVNE